jgi:hypothetical protein
MRRRQIYAMQAERGLMRISYVGPEVKFEVERASLPRGACQKCGRHIGQGLAMHRKSCKGVADG